MWGQPPSAVRRAQLGYPMKWSLKLGGSCLTREICAPAVSYPLSQYPTVSSTSRTRNGCPVSLSSAGHLSVGRHLTSHSSRQLWRVKEIANARNFRCAMSVERLNPRHRHCGCPFGGLPLQLNEQNS